jgi:hypothetical protein
MPAITSDSLLTLEAYAKERNDFRARVMAHKQTRVVHLGAHITLIFEDELTIRYQVQEMLRVERIFEEGDIREELQTYNPLVPNGSNWKATMMIEYPDVEERKRKLGELVGVEDRIWVQAADAARVYAVADEDLERATDEKTSAVHFLRFELDRNMIDALRDGAALTMGADHPHYQATVDVDAAVKASLLNDLTV